MVHIDGGARGNPGPAGAGVVVRSADDEKVLFEGGFFLGTTTNNVAEYHALLRGLRVALRLGADGVEVRSDSQLLVRQMTGRYRVRNHVLRELFERARELSKGFRRCSFRHVPRESNRAADALVNRAINMKSDVRDAAGD